MRVLVAVCAVLGAVSFSGTLAGCGGSGSDQDTTPPAASNLPAPVAGKNAPVTPAPPAAVASGSNTPMGGKETTARSLGTVQPAGPFQVTLTSTPRTPKAGSALLSATVTKNGQPVTNAVVTVSLSMPSMSMKGATITLKPVGSHYEGKANLEMAADWEARTTIKAAGASGTATYDFKVS